MPRLMSHESPASDAVEGYKDIVDSILELITSIMDALLGLFDSDDEKKDEPKPHEVTNALASALK